MTSPTIDMEAFKALQELMEEDMPDAVALYLSHTKEILDAMKAAIDDGDYEQLSRYGHQLKPSSLQMGLLKMYHLSKDIELGIDENQSKYNYDILCKEFTLVEAFLTDYCSP